MANNLSFRLSVWAAKKVEETKERVDDVIEASVAEGAADMKQMIMTRGTGRTWTRPGPSGRTGSYPGRVDSGNMLNAVGSSFRRGGQSEGRFGWLGGDPQGYYGLQEGGFRHVSGIDVPGMYALQDARADTIAKVVARIKQGV